MSETTNYTNQPPYWLTLLIFVLMALGTKQVHIVQWDAVSDLKCNYYIIGL